MGNYGCKHTDEGSSGSGSGSGTYFQLAYAEEQSAGSVFLGGNSSAIISSPILSFQLPGALLDTYFWIQAAVGDVNLYYVHFDILVYNAGVLIAQQTLGRCVNEALGGSPPIGMTTYRFGRRIQNLPSGVTLTAQVKMFQDGLNNQATLLRSASDPLIMCAYTVF